MSRRRQRPAYSTDCLPVWALIAPVLCIASFIAIGVMLAWRG